MEHQVSEHSIIGGSRLLYIRVPGAKTYYWNTSIRAGWRYSTADKFELPHLAEHLAFSGSKKFTEDEFLFDVEKDGTFYNASTGTNYITYKYGGLKDRLDRIIPINISQMFEPLYEPEKVKREQSVIIQEMHRYKENDAWRSAYLNHNSILPEVAPDIDERIALIDKTSRKDLVKYHDQYYTVENSDFILAGDYDEQQFEAFIARLKAQLEPVAHGNKQDIKSLRVGNFAGRVKAVDPYSEKQAYMYISWLFPSRNHSDVPALHIISAMLCHGMASRLLRKARAAGLTYAIHAQSGASTDMTALSIHSQCRIDKIEPLMKLTAEEIAEVASGNFREEEFERAKGFIDGSILSAFQTPRSFVNWYGERFLLGEDPESIEQYLGRIHKVTHQDLVRVGKKYIKFNNMTATFVGKGLVHKTAKYEKICKAAFS